VLGHPAWQALLGVHYVPAEMAVYGVFRLPLMTNDVQWRATYFLSIILPFAPNALFGLSEGSPSLFVPVDSVTKSSLTRDTDDVTRKLGKALVFIISYGRARRAERASAIVQKEA
jgi:hypothetical protein